MQTMQVKILENIEGTITRLNVEPLIQNHLGNIGTIYAQDGLKTVLKLRYRFNEDYASFDGDIHIAYMDYAKEEDIQRLLEMITETIKKNKRINL